MKSRPPVGFPALFKGRRTQERYLKFKVHILSKIMTWSYPTNHLISSNLSQFLIMVSSTRRIKRKQMYVNFLALGKHRSKKYC